MAEEKYGIQETKELLSFVFSLAEAIKKSNADGDFNWRDGLNFIEPLKKLGPAIDNIEDIIPEIADLDADDLFLRIGILKLKMKMMIFLKKLKKD